MIRVILPAHLRNLAKVQGEIQIEIADPPCLRTLLDALEAKYPMLRGTIRNYGDGQRRDFIRFFACGLDLSHESPDTPLPEKVIAGKEPYFVVGAMAGG